MTAQSLEELAAYRRCPRERYYAFVMDRVRIEREPSFGSMWRAVMRSVWFAEPMPADASDPYTQAKLDALYAGYCARWDIRPGESERGGDGEAYDALYRADAIRWRTTGDSIELGSSYWDRFDIMDWEPSIALTRLGERAVFYVHDVARKPQLRPSAKGESPEAFRKRILVDIQKDPAKYYARYTVSRSHEERARTMEQVNATIVDMDLGSRRQNPDACSRWGGRCAYYDVCRGTTSINDDRLFQIRRQ